MANKDFLFRAKADTRNYDANIAKAKQQLDGFAKANLSAGGAIKQLSGSLVSVAARFASVTAAVGALGAAFRSNIQTALGFEKSMSQLSSLTGMVGKDLEKLKGYAIELGSSTTLTASQVADAFKMIGSQQPQLLQSGEALKQVTKYAIQLSEAAGIELSTAAQTLSTSINQMGGDSSNAARFVNVLAAASQKGAGDIAWLGEALTKSATAAKAVGTGYEELVANLEQLAKAGFDAATAGTALRSIIMNLEKQSNQNFKPSVVGLTQAFENLGKANLSLTQYQELAGKLFATQTKVLAEAAGEAKNMTEAITGTNIAEEQAKTNTDNLDGSLKSLSSAWEGLNLHINSSNGFLRDCVDWLKGVVKWSDQAFTSAGRAAKLLQQIRGGEGQNHSDIVQGRLDALKNASPEERDAVNKRNAEYFSSMEAQAWKMAQRTKAELDNTWRGRSIKRYNLERQYEKYVNSANSYRALGQEYATSANAIMNPVADVVIPDPVKPIPIKGGGGSGKGGKGGTTAATIDELLSEGAKEVKSKAFDFSDAAMGATQSMKQLQDILRMYNDALLNATNKQEYNAALSGIEETQAKINAQPTALKTGLTIEQVQFHENFTTQVREQLEEEFRSHPLEIELSGGKKMKKLALENEEAWTGVADALQSAAGAMAAFNEPSLNIAATIAKSIASVAFAFSQSLKGTATPWDFIAGVAGGVAAMASAVAAIKSVGKDTGEYADGGIIPGNNFSGDNLTAHVNSGELILNRAAQGNLASLLNDGRTNAGTVNATVSADTIRLTLRNGARKVGKSMFDYLEL